MSVDLRHFRSFVLVAEEGNIGRASDRLFITQPALSRQMQQLERSVGSTLLVRSAHGVELTDAGREMLVRARRTLEAVDDALAVGRDDSPRGRLTLGLTMAGRRDEWYEVCGAFADRYPEVEIEARVALSESLQQQVIAGELDGALVLAPNRSAALSYAVVRTDRLEVWMNRGHPLADRSEIGIDELDGQAVTLVGGPAGAASGFNAAVRALFDDTDISPQFVETPHVFPPRAMLDRSYLGISPPLDFPDGVVGAPLVPERTMAFEFVHRQDAARAAVLAFAPFAADYLSRPCRPGMSRT